MKLDKVWNEGRRRREERSVIGLPRTHPVTWLLVILRHAVHAGSVFIIMMRMMDGGKQGEQSQFFSCSRSCLNHDEYENDDE